MMSLLDPDSLLFISEVDLREGLRLGIGRKGCPPTFDLAMSQVASGGRSSYVRTLLAHAVN